MKAMEHPAAILRTALPIQGERSVIVPWWSITKTVLSAAILKLVELGAVRLDDHFEDWPFTIRQLLQHTSGLPTYGGYAYQQAVAEGQSAWTIDALLARTNARRLLFDPGKGWAYSNIGYLLIRQLLERTTTSNIDAAIHQLVFAPLQIRNSRIALTTSDLLPTHWGNRTNYDPGWVYHGLLIGPPTDAVMFLARLLDGDLVTPELLLAMQEPRFLGGELSGRPWRTTGYGLGVMIGTMDCVGRVVGHSGGGPTSVSALYAFLDLPGRPIVAAFAQGNNEGIAEHEAVRLAKAG